MALKDLWLQIIHFILEEGLIIMCGCLVIRFSFATRTKVSECEDCELLDCSVLRGWWGDEHSSQPPGSWTGSETQPSITPSLCPFWDLSFLINCTQCPGEDTDVRLNKGLAKVGFIGRKEASENKLHFQISA